MSRRVPAHRRCVEDLARLSDNSLVWIQKIEQRRAQRYVTGMNAVRVSAPFTGRGKGTTVPSGADVSRSAPLDLTARGYRDGVRRSITVSDGNPMPAR